MNTTTKPCETLRLKHPLKKLKIKYHDWATYFVELLCGAVLSSTNLRLSIVAWEILGVNVPRVEARPGNGSKREQWNGCDWREHGLSRNWLLTTDSPQCVWLSFRVSTNRGEMVKRAARGGKERLPGQVPSPQTRPSLSPSSATMEDGRQQ